MDQWGKIFAEGGRKIGRSFTIFEDNIQKEAMRQAGFVNIEGKDFKASITSIKVTHSLTMPRIPLVPGLKTQNYALSGDMRKLRLTKMLRELYYRWPLCWGGRRQRSRYLLHTSVAKSVRPTFTRTLSRR